MFWAYALVAAFSITVFYSLVAGSSYAVSEIFGLSPLHYGVLILSMSGTFIASNFVSGRIVQTYGTERLVRLGAIGGLIAVVLVASISATAPSNPAWYLLPCVIFALANGFVVANATAAAISVVPEAAGTASGLLGFLQLTISGIVDQLVGWSLTDTTWPIAAAMFLCGFGSFALVVAVWVLRDKSGPTTAAGAKRASPAP